MLVRDFFDSLLFDSQIVGLEKGTILSKTQNKKMGSWEVEGIRSRQVSILKCSESSPWSGLRFGA